MHKQNKTVARWVALALLGLSGSGHAAGSDELKKQIDELKATVDALGKQLQEQRPASETAFATKDDIDGIKADLENYKYDDKRLRETKTALSTRSTTIGGIIQTRFSYQDPKTNAGSTSPADFRNSSFDIPSAQLNFSGSLYRDYAEGRNLDYRLGFIYAKTAPASNNSNLNLADAYLRYSFAPTVTGLEEPKTTLTFGQQLIPYGLEAQVGEDLRPVINPAQFLGGQGVGARQLGAILRGDIDPYVDYGFNYRAPLLEYALGIVNGSGPNKSDDNKQKDILARAAVTLPVDYNSVLRELKFGVSYYKGKKNLATAAAPIYLTQGRNDRKGFDIYYNHVPFGISYEFSQGNDEALTASREKQYVTSRGQYLTLFYTWGEQFVNSYKNQAKYDDWWPQSHQLFVRWDTFNPDIKRETSASDQRSTIYTAGYNLFFAETTKLQVNLNHYSYADTKKEGVNELLLQFQYGF